MQIKNEDLICFDTCDSFSIYWPNSTHVSH